MAPLILGLVLNPINSSIIATALAPIAVALHASEASASWLISGLYLATAVGQPTMGMFVDRVGPRRILLLGFAIALIASIGAALAPSLGVLIAMRVLLGIATATAYPSALATIRLLGTRENASNALAVVAITGQATVAVGPTLGGLLIALGGWRATFLVNIPVTVLGIVWALWWLPKDTAQARMREVFRGLDYGGIALFAIGICGLLVSLMSLQHPRVLTWVVGIAASAAFVYWELRHERPFIDLRIVVGKRALSATYGRYALTFLATYAIFYGLPLWLESVRGLSPLAAGLVLLPMPVAAIVCAFIARRRPLFGTLTAVGISLAAGSLVLYFGRSLNVALVVGFAALCFGLSSGFASVANQRVLYAQAPKEQIGLASGLLRSSQYIGAMFSAGAIDLIFASRAGDARLAALALMTLLVGFVLTAATIADPSIRATATSAPTTAS